MKNSENGQITFKDLPLVLQPIETVVHAKGNLLPCGRKPFTLRFAVFCTVKGSRLRLKESAVVLLTVGGKDGGGGRKP